MRWSHSESNLIKWDNLVLLLAVRKGLLTGFLSPEIRTNIRKEPLRSSVVCIFWPTAYTGPKTMIQTVHIIDFAQTFNHTKNYHTSSGQNELFCYTQLCVFFNTKSMPIKINMIFGVIEGLDKSYNMKGSNYCVGLACAQKIANPRGTGEEQTLQCYQCNNALDCLIQWCNTYQATTPHCPHWASHWNSKPLPPRQHTSDRLKAPSQLNIKQAACS